MKIFLFLGSMASLSVMQSAALQMQASTQSVVHPKQSVDHPPPPPQPPLPPPSKEVVAKGPRPPIPSRSVGNWLTQDDYPVAALKAEKEGMRFVDVTVSADGRVADCKATGTAGPELHAAACASIQRRGRFTPAIDAQGNKVVGKWRHVMQWTLPNPQSKPEPFISQ